MQQQNHQYQLQHGQPQNGIKLFPNYNPPNASYIQSTTVKTAGNKKKVANKSPENSKYQTQTLAPLRLSQEHFIQNSKNNTIGTNYKQQQEPSTHKINQYQSPPPSPQPPELPIRNGILAGYNQQFNNSPTTIATVVNGGSRKAIRHYH